MRRFTILLTFVLAGVGLFLFFNIKKDVQLAQVSQITEVLVEENKEVKKPEIDPNADIPLQRPLENPPEVVKAVYATGWSGGYQPRLNYLIDLIKKTELNAIIIDIKDYSGELSYHTELEEVERYSRGREIKILHPNAMIKKLHDAGIYVIARQTIFQDPILALARTDLALVSSSTRKQWKDNKGVMWVDAASKDVWDYNITIAKDALARGFDEINFDYIRFQTDGNMDDIRYPFWDGIKLKRFVIRDFWKYLRKALPDAKLSADLFGLVTLNYGDIGIGQNIDDAFNYFDAIAPMVYPSHYHPGFDGYKNPAKVPYEVVYSSMAEANERLKHYISNAQNSTSTEVYLVKNPKLRPWLQDFDLGVSYDAAKVRAQIMATYSAAGACQKSASSTDQSGFVCDDSKMGLVGGWMLWDPKNVYTKEALLNE